MNTTVSLRPMPPPAPAFRRVAPVQVPRITTLLAILGLLADRSAGPADLFAKVDQPGWTNSYQYSLSAAWGDYDGDGFPDLVVANASSAGTGFNNFVYRNLGDGTFRRQLASDVGPIASDREVTGAFWWGDINNDGTLDLVAMNTLWNQGDPPVASRLYVNQGHGTFSPAQAGALTAPQYAVGLSSWCDYDNDGYLDAFLTTAWTDAGRRTNVLLHARGDLTMEVVTQGPVATNRISSLFSNDATWSDFDGDGDMDLFVSNPGGVSDFAFRNEGHGRFVRMTNSILESPDYQSAHLAWGDLDNDGDLDVATMAWSDNGMVLLRHDAMESFVAVTHWDIAATPVWLDYDNDGFLDLLFTRGQSGPEKLVLVRNQGDGNFLETEDAFTRTPNRWFNVAMGDYDNNGFVDLFFVAPTGANALFRNQGNGNHWIKFQLTGTAANRSAIGAKVRVKATIAGRTMWQMREVFAAGTSGNDLRPNFGLGDATVAEEVRVEWPSGNVNILTNLPADQLIRVTEVVNIVPARPVATLNGSISLGSTNITTTTRQWYFEGTPLVGQTGQALSLNNLQAAQAGRYTVVAQTGAGPLTNHVYLRIIPQFAKVVEGNLATDLHGSRAATWFDYDNDGLLDAFVTCRQFYAPSGSDAFYRNLGAGVLTRLPDSALTLHGGISLTATAGDYDNDGDADLYLNRDAGHSGLFRNDGPAGFTPLTSPNSPNTTGWDADWADYDRDGDLDLVVAPNPDKLVLYRNDGPDTFTKVTANAAGELLNFGTSLTLWADADLDGWPDLWAHDFSVLRLYRNNADGTFSRVRQGSLVGSTSTSSGGLAWGDYDNDGLPDLYAAGNGNPDSLHRNLGKMMFTLIPRAGDMVPGHLGGSRAADWGDYDNDGFLDLVTFLYNGPGKLYRNRGDGTFQSVDAGNLLTDGVRRVSAVWVDYDNDGFLDLMVSCGDAETPSNYPAVQNQLYRNRGNRNHWLKVKLVGTTSNRDGIGAKVRVQATLAGRLVNQIREISGNCGQHSVPLLAHFGLGDATKATKVSIEWPSGTFQNLSDLAADKLHTIAEPPIIRLVVSLVTDGLRVEWRGESNTTYTVQSSVNLKSWGTIRNLTTDAAGAASTILPIEGTVRLFRVSKK